MCTEEKGLHFKSSLNESVISHVVSKKRSQVRDGKRCYFPKSNTYIVYEALKVLLCTLFFNVFTQYANVMHTQYVPFNGVPGFIIMRKTFYRKKKNQIIELLQLLLKFYGAFLSFNEYIPLHMHPPLYQPLVYEDNVNILKNIFVIEESLLITKCLVPVATG